MPTVLILGATSDISVAIAKRFAAENYTIQLAARNPELLAPIRSDIAIRYNTACTVHAFEATDFPSHSEFFERLDPKPDITICVFGMMEDEERAFSDFALARLMIDTNYTGAVSIMNIAAKYYSGQKKGTLVGISSVAGERGRQSKLIYGSAKAAFSAYLSGLRNLLFKDGVHVVSVKPGFVYTRMTEEMKLPASLTAQPSEVANAVYKAVLKKGNTVYVKWMWRWIMLIIRNIPEPIFKKLKL